MAKATKLDKAVRPNSWLIHFFAEVDGSVPGRIFLLEVPQKVREMFVAVLKAVADAPPPAFAGGGKWEVMHDDMAGVYEVRVDGPARRHYRLFCLLERDGAKLGLGGSSIVVLTGKSKAFRTTLSKSDYAEVRQFVVRYRSQTPRRVAQ